MIVDRRHSVGSPARCAGYVPNWLQPRAGFDASAVLQSVKGIRLVTSGRPVCEIRAPGLILDRTRFDKTLAIRALEAGADLANALVLRREEGRVVVRRNGLEASFEGQVILGADGPGSVIGRSIGQANRQFLATVQYEVGLRSPESWAEYHQLPRGEPGYAWFVPCGRTARVGVGLQRSRARFLKSHLDRFMRQLASDGRVHAEAIIGCTGGLVPANGPLDSVQVGKVLLAGDAGGLFSCFGCGVAAAVISGEVAGQAVGGALAGADVRQLPAYDPEVRQRMPLGVDVDKDGFEHLARRMERMAEWRG